MPVMISREDIKKLKEQEENKKTPSNEAAENNVEIKIDKRIFP